MFCIGAFRSLLSVVSRIALSLVLATRSAMKPAGAIPIEDATAVPVPSQSHLDMSEVSGPIGISADCVQGSDRRQRGLPQL